MTIGELMAWHDDVRSWGGPTAIIRARIDAAAEREYRRRYYLNGFREPPLDVTAGGGYVVPLDYAGAQERPFGRRN